MKVAIIGSGMAGLTAGAYLAKAGHAVTVFEQFPTPGGVTATVRQDGFGWDIGPLLIEGFAPGDKGRRDPGGAGRQRAVPCRARGSRPGHARVCLVETAGV